MNTARIVRTSLVFLVIAGSLVACDVETFDEAVKRAQSNTPTPPPAEPPPPPPPPAFAATFSEIQANVFTPTCATANCHAGANPSASLNLEEANSYAMLVDIASSQVAGTLRVAPADPDNSYLIQKLGVTPAVGVQMPLGGTALLQSTIDIIRQWIIDGATDDRVQPPLDPIRVASLSPAPGAVLVAAPAQIIAGFDRQPDASTVNANTFVLEASGGDSTFGDGNEITVAATSINVPGGNPQTAVFDLTGVVLADETYRVSLLGNGASVLMDMDGNALDGEFAGGFPSGNGTAGGDFRASFSVSTPIVIGPTLDQIQAVVFTPSCATAGCHDGPAGNPLPAGLDLSDADASLASLVNVPSVQQPTIMLVVPTDPDNSYLIQKLGNMPSTGAQMPLSRPALDPAVIDEIRQWILDGAVR